MKTSGKQAGNSLGIQHVYFHNFTFLFRLEFGQHHALNLIALEKKIIGAPELKSLRLENSHGLHSNLVITELVVEIDHYQSSQSWGFL